MARRSRSRSRDLAGLAALGALGFMAGKGLYKRAGEELAPVDNRDISRVPVGTAAREALASPDEDFPSAGRTLAPLASPDEDFPRAERTRARAPVTPVAAPAAARRDGSGSGYLDLGGYNDMAQVNTPRGYDPRLANLSSAAVGASEAAAIRNAANAQMPLRQQLTQTTLGVPTARAADAPSIYAGPEAWQAYRQRQAAEAAAAATPPAPPGSARNIVKQMREKDQAVLAAVRRRQEQEAAAAQAAREAQAERLREARRGQKPASNPADLRFQDLQRRMGFKEGGAVKAKVKPKKMASGGMSSASKRGDGIASKGKTKCKMY